MTRAADNAPYDAPPAQYVNLWRYKYSRYSGLRSFPCWAFRMIGFLFDEYSLLLRTESVL